MLYRYKLLIYTAFRLNFVVFLRPQLDERWPVSGSGYDEWCGEHQEQERRGEGEDRAAGRLGISHLVYYMESFQVRLFSTRIILWLFGEALKVCLEPNSIMFQYYDAFTQIQHKATGDQLFFF